MKNIGIVTSGGDAPGMNAAIRTIVRLAGAGGREVTGFERGWEGLITNKTIALTPRSVSGIIQQGGTILHTSRCKDFKTPEGMRKSSETLKQHDIDSLIVMGGDGSLHAALDFSRATGINIIGIPATIDNDVFGTDETIGFDTAVNTAVAEIDKIRDTATSLDRIFIVEVMGRTRGFLAAMIGLTVGAEIILVPELKFSAEDICKSIRSNYTAGKKSGIIVAAEGIGDTRALAIHIEKTTGIETRLSVLGYAQRGGSPTARSRYLATRFGEKAVQLLEEGIKNAVVCLRKGEVTSLPLEEACDHPKMLNLDLLRLAGDLAR